MRYINREFTAQMPDEKLEVMDQEAILTIKQWSNSCPDKFSKEFHLSK